MPIDPFATLTELSAALARGSTSALELADLYLHRIRHANRKLNAFVHVDEELTRRHARAADERRASGVTLSRPDTMTHWTHGFTPKILPRSLIGRTGCGR